MRGRPLRRWMAVLALPLWLVSFLPGQAVNARIYGDVQNEEGEYLGGVWVTAINISNNAETTAFTSGEKGTFRFLGLAPGIYQVSFDMEGYQSYVASGIKLSADQSATLHIKLKPLAESDGLSSRSLPFHSRPPASDLPAGPWKKWQLELASGAIYDEPDDLNSFVAYDRSLCKSKAYYYFYTYGFIPVNFIGQATGQLKPLGGSRPLTARVRFSLNKTFSLALGIGYFDQQQVSTYSVSFVLNTRLPEFTNYPRQFTVSNEIPDYRLGVKGFFPHVGAQASMAPGRGLRLAGFVNAGWMFAECRYSSTRKLQDGFSNQNSNYEVALNGRGSGLTLECGAKLEWALWRGLGLFVEGHFQSCRVKNVTGERSSSEIIQDRDTLEVEFRSMEKSQGLWVLSGKEYPYPFIPSPGAATEYDPFTLDLGGPGLRTGVFFRF
ncbi:MAG: carboxypeptidase regulatory-like domain-containing protein [Candidatus Aminicenantes bacterium]|nr:carboxypeptidase regulatory-like domain-containing protein [Candidatus Aminicenantes bacterium]